MFANEMDICPWSNKGKIEKIREYRKANNKGMQNFSIIVLLVKIEKCSAFIFYDSISRTVPRLKIKIDFKLGKICWWFKKNACE